MPPEGQSDKMVSAMEVHMKQQCVNEFLYAEKNGTYWHSLINAEGLLRSNWM